MTPISRLAKPWNRNLSRRYIDRLQVNLAILIMQYYTVRKLFSGSVPQCPYSSHRLN